MKSMLSNQCTLSSQWTHRTKLDSPGHTFVKFYEELTELSSKSSYLTDPSNKSKEYKMCVHKGICILEHSNYIYALHVMTWCHVHVCVFVIQVFL